MKKAIFLDRDGTLVAEPPDEQVDSLEKLEFLPGVFRALSQVVQKTGFELVIVSNQDGLGSAKYPEERYNTVQSKIETAFRNEGVVFSDILIDRSFEKDNSPDRKPRTGMLKKYTDGSYDLSECFVIGDRITDIELAKNLGAKGIMIGGNEAEKKLENAGLLDHCIFISDNWQKIAEYIILTERKAIVERNTRETRIKIELNLDGNGKADIKTGIGFFDHMLEQIARHGLCDLNITVNGDLHVDEHHTIEDTGLALGEAFDKAFGDKRGTERYGFVLPMDESLAQVAVDFGGRPWLVWDVEFKREMIGEMPAEMFFHFFKSFTDTARCNLNIKAEGVNEHHKIEAVFKAFAKSIKMAKNRDIDNFELPSTKGVL